MDVSKLFTRSPEQGDTVASKQAGPIVKQKSPPEIVKDYLDEDMDRFTDEGGSVIEEVETQIRAPVHILSSMTTPVSILRHPLSQRFHEILYEVGALHDKKQKDYGTKDDPFANVRGATRFGLPAPMGAFIAMSDIMQRIESFCINGRLENEPLDNALRDMAVYSIIALVLYEEEQAAKDEDGKN